MMSLNAEILNHLAPTPEDDAHTLPAALYVDPSYLELEYRGIFESYWQLVAHQS